MGHLPSPSPSPPALRGQAYGEGVGGASPALRGIMGRGWVGHLLH